MTKYLSRKLKFITLFAMIAVVFIHSYNYSDSFLTAGSPISEGFNPGAMFQYFISNGLALFAVPLFFGISGYLFFYTFRPSAKCYKYKLKSRFFSLLVPFLIWTAVSGLFVFFCTFSNHLSALNIVQSCTESIRQYGFWGIFQWLIQPPAFQFWYIQQLILFTVLSPVLYFLIKYTKALILIPAVILWIFDLNFILHSEAILFFMAGAALAIFCREDLILQKESRPFTAGMAAVWVLLNLARSFLAAGESAVPALKIVNAGLGKISCIVGIVSMWLLFDHIVKRIENKKGILLLTGHLFFIYALHEPLLHICYELALSNMNGAGDPTRFVLYLCLPVSIIAFSVIVSMCVRKLCLPLHKALTGNRSN